MSPITKKVWNTILQSLNLSQEAYQCCLCEIEFGLDYHPWLTGQKIHIVYVAMLSGVNG